MKHRLLAIAAAAFLTLAPMTAFAQGPADPACPNCPTGGVPKKDGTGGPGAKKGQKQGQGPRDGTGPRHTPQRQGRGGGRR
jgi:hypothetical protein